MGEHGAVRVAVLGCGYWGSKHARVMQTLTSVAELALIDTDTERLHRLCGSLPGAEGYTDLDEALERVDAIVIATPPTTHGPLALRAIAGKHVLVEKPLATPRMPPGRHRGQLHWAWTGPRCHDPVQ